ncbi:MAG: hypothetical protein RLZZ617_734 [Bacteroidota bacterium]
MAIFEGKIALFRVKMPYFGAIKLKPIHVRNVENYTHPH